MTLIETIQTVRAVQASRDAQAQSRGFSSAADEERATNNRAILARFVKSDR